MSFVEIDLFRIHYTLTGASQGPVLIFSNSLGATLSMWDAQLEAFEPSFRVLRYDTRGHGDTLATPGPYSVEQLGQDVIALMDTLRIPTASFCGLSMGGMIGMWLARNAPDRLRKLVLCSTAVRIGTIESWNERIATVLRDGMMPIAPVVIQRWFTSDFRTHFPEATAGPLRMLQTAPPEGYAANCAAVRDGDLTSTVKHIAVPTLVVCGTHDAVTTPADSRFLTNNIPGSRYLELEGSHLCNIEAAERFNAEVRAFLEA